ncbi:endonuclease [Flavobacterium humi]|uniref:T9SS type A sorting domain-containing protein n=1 Tax=Flavobacterium humi TaxID=2562683 RepID=A0A4Z0LCG4_9FLAO|nr:endonuclease [Flavobacterium humi]TGD59557.1 T9SS type A sorting domain-containing protein [Flavobacterium humi]
MIKKLLLLLLFTHIGYSQVVINELDSDTPSTDDKEFIELKSTVPNTSLDGYVLVFFNGANNQSYLTMDLDGITTNSNGIATIGASLLSPVPNRYLPFDSIIQNGPDAVALYWGNGSDFPTNSSPTMTNLIDALVHETNDADPTALMAALGETVSYDEGATSALATSQSIQRKTDGTYEAKAPTPGANNDGSGDIYNGITISVNTSHKNENQSFDITFTTQTNVTADLNFNFTLANGTFTTADYTGSTSVFIATGSNTATKTIQLVDDAFDEGDEILRIKFAAIPTGFVKMNDNIDIRVIDNDFTTAPWGTPLNPTHGLVANTMPAGYYDSLEGLSGAALKQALQDIIANPSVVRAHNYGDVTDILKVADQNPQNSNQVWMMYVEAPRAKLDYQTGSSNIGTWNREHIYCQSRGGFTDGTSGTADGINVWLPTNADDILSGHADAHHIRAEDGPENSSRNERNYGSDYNGPLGNQGSWHGDVARAVFYMCVRYNGLNVVNGNPAQNPDGFIGDLATLLAWNVSDPSDDFEMHRNNYIYTWQYNRNPFIDHPDLADHIWGTKTTVPWSASLSNPDFEASKIVLYPNPANHYIMISGVSTDVPLDIYSTTGIKVYSGIYKHDSHLDLSLPAGVYMVTFSQDEQSITKKLIIQ